MTGYTKLVERSKGDGVYINTTGVGRVRSGMSVACGNVLPPDGVMTCPKCDWPAYLHFRNELPLRAD